MIQLINPSEANLNLDNANVQLEPASQGVQKSYRGERDDNLELEAGAYYVFVRNTDPSGATLTVNGEEISFNGSWSAEDRFDHPANRQDFVEAISIQANGTNYFLRVSYPSDSPFDPNSL